MSKKFLITTLLLLALCITGQPNIDKSNNSTNYKVVEHNKIELQKNKILKRIKKYNPFVKSVLINDIHNTLKCFKLTPYTDILVSQLCLESRGGYKKGNSKNVMGIGQITAETAFHYLMNKTTDKDKKLLYSLKIDNFDFIYSNKDRYSLNNKSVKVKMIQWLSKERNNVALWGFIMKKNLDDHRTINKALLAYNGGGNKNYVNAIYGIKRK